jgi:hypothetical protein
VGSVRGLEAWRRDGNGKRVISKGAAFYPRWLDKQSVLVVQLTGGRDLAEGGWLERISLADGKRVRVAKLPPFACAGQPSAESEVETPAFAELDLAIQDPGDFVVDQSGELACLTLMDRNLNMAGVSVGVQVDLKTGKVSRWLELGEEECKPPKGVKVGEMKGCSPRSDSKSPPAETSFPFAFEDEQVIALGPSGSRSAVARLPGYTSEVSSPSGRWVVLGGDVEEGDYIHRLIVLLDRTTGDVLPIRQRPGAWPAPLAAKGSKPPRRIPTPVRRTISVVGETDLRWLGRSAASELLVVDDLVLRPERASFLVKGQIAR